MKRVVKCLFGLLVIISVLFVVGCDNLLNEDDDGGTDGGGGGDTGVASLTVVNNSGYSIYYLYISPTSSTSWGPDQLGENIISNGGSFTVNNIPAGTYDLRVETSSSYGYYAQRGNYYLASGTSYTWTITTLYY